MQFPGEDIPQYSGRWWIIKAIVRDVLCWLLWHNHHTDDGHLCMHCRRCGEHLERHSL